MELELIFFSIGLCYLLLWLYRTLQTLRRVFFGTKVTPERYGVDSWALVTGCTEGIGKALVTELAARGFNVVLVARNLEKLEKCAREVQEKHKRETRVIAFDFAKDCSTEAYSRIVAKVQDLDISVLVNNVGIISSPHGFVMTPSDKIYEETVVNTYPQALLTKGFLNSFEQRYR